MKIVFFGGISARDGEPLVFDKAGTAHTYSYFLREEFHKRGIVTDRFGSGALEKRPETIPCGDHLLSVSQRGITKYGERIGENVIFERLRPKFKGLLTSICDYSWGGEVLEDMIFFARPGIEYPKHKYIGWAASPEWLKPKKNKDYIYILIDHTLYHEGLDTSADIIRQCLKFKESSSKPVKVMRFISGGVEEVLTENQKPAVYDRVGMPYPECVKEYNRADIFIPTHHESMGLSILECAMAGALIVSQRGYIKPELLSDLNHVIHDGTIDFDKALKVMNSDNSRARALKYNWKTAADRILEVLK